MAATLTYRYAFAKKVQQRTGANEVETHCCKFKINNAASNYIIKKLGGIKIRLYTLTFF